MIEFKGISAECPVGLWLEHRAVDQKARARTGFSPHPSIKFELGLNLTCLCQIDFWATSP